MEIAAFRKYYHFTGLELVENHIEKALKTATADDTIVIRDDSSSDAVEFVESRQGTKRPAGDDPSEPEPKKPHLVTNNVNGSITSVDSPAPDSACSSTEEEGTATVSTAAAKLFADIAADILEDEDEDELLQQQPPPINAEEQGIVQVP